MILIADSGSTKTDWLLANNNQQSILLQTQGISPIHMSQEQISSILCNELLPQLPKDINKTLSIFFYGSGCTESTIPALQNTLHNVFPNSHIEVASDLLGAARALCGNTSGIACILGTGSNSCLYDGHNIIQNTPALGYILGDEGSGAVIGRLIVNALFKGQLPIELRHVFCETYNTSMTDIIDKVYRQPMPNRTLATYANFAVENRQQPFIHDMIINAFRAFLCKNVRPYGRPDLNVNAVGSVAYLLSEELQEAAKYEKFNIGNIIRKPITNLLNYHISDKT